MNHNSSKRQRREEEENDNVSMNSSMDNTTIGDVKNAKMVALEVERKWGIFASKFHNHFTDQKCSVGIEK
jgi:hypothetical protein